MFVIFSFQFVWMWIFLSMFVVSVSLMICAKFYKEIIPGLRLNSTELVLFPFRLIFDLLNIKILIFCSSIKIPNVNERLERDSVGKTLASNLVYTIWAVFGGFILHFLLCNYLEILLRPYYEEPVETAADIIKRDIIPFTKPNSEIMRQFFAASNDTNYQEISRRLVVPKNIWPDFYKMAYKVMQTGSHSYIGNLPPVYEAHYKYWYRSSETIGGFNPYKVHLSNKKWPLKKVLYK